jgi:Trk K+ transport system NAD-binding subunit
VQSADQPRLGRVWYNACERGMSDLRVESLHVSGRRRRFAGTRAWREWCFLRAAFRHFRVRFLIMAVILLGGALLFRRLEPEKRLSLPKATYYTWSLVFGEAPEEFPKSFVLQALFFLMPVLGLTVIIEGIVDFAFMVRDRRRFERSWCMSMASSMSDHIILVGFGKLGYQIFRLLRRLGEAVVVLERDEQNQFLEEVRRDGAPLFIGDARREIFLKDANIAKARSIIVATNDDLSNLEIALDARRLNPHVRVVLRMFDQNMADKIGAGFDIRTAMSQSAISAPAFATAAIDPSIIQSLVVNDQLVVMQRWQISAGSPLCGRRIGDVMAEFRLGIVERRPGGAAPVLFPPPDTLLMPGDELIIQGSFELITHLCADARALA